MATAILGQCWHTARNSGVISDNVLCLSLFWPIKDKIKPLQWQSLLIPILSLFISAALSSIHSLISCFLWTSCAVLQLSAVALLFTCAAAASNRLLHPGATSICWSVRMLKKLLNFLAHILCQHLVRSIFLKCLPEIPQKIRSEYFQIFYFWATSVFISQWRILGKHFLSFLHFNFIIFTLVTTH